ncbi:MAG: DUF1939 domain-containing protein [Verrucomicrobia bacterium]|nr:DUF1939 domain-containing protein [Verrucomicrobiota bacterium]
MFAEIFTGSQSTFDYWRNGGVKMRYLDFPLKQQVIGDAFNNGNLGALASIGGPLDPTEGVMFVQSHDQQGPGKLELGYAWLLTHVGVPVVYFSGNNISWADKGTRTWVLPGIDGALGDNGNGTIPNLVWVHNQFARGREWGRVTDNDYFAFERYVDGNSNQNPDSGEAVLIVALNDSGGDQTRTFQTSFPDGTQLKDQTGNNSDIVTVSGGNVTIRVPGRSGQGFVCYAPYVASADGDPLRFSGSSTMNWIVPGGRDAPSKSRTVTRLTGDSTDIDVHYFDPSGGAVGDVLVKWGQGRDLNAGATDFTGKDLVRGGFEQAAYVGPGGKWRLTADLTGVPEGLHVVKARLFNSGAPVDRYQTFHEVVYVDRTGPSLDVTWPSEGQTIDGEAVATIMNSDKTAYGMQISIDGGANQTAHKVMKGTWKYSLTGLSSGVHTMTVYATEADYGNPRQIINNSSFSRVFSVNTTGPSIAINHANNAEIKLPFFLTRLTVDGGLGTSDVTLWWDGYEMNGLAGTGTIDHYFTGGYRSGGVDETLYGAFCNGPHFFEAEVRSGGQTQHVARTVFFNLYGNNLTDSDGDGLPDDVELPGFTGGLDPDEKHPGDNNQDMIPNDGETWGKLNPLNHDTFYSGTWDGDGDWDSDGANNLCEVMQGFIEFNDPFHYNIYDGGSKPANCTISQPSKVTTSCGATTLSIEYEQNDGPLANPVGNIYITIGHDNFQDSVDAAMTFSDGAWHHDYTHTVATAVVDFYFHDQDSPANVDNNSGGDWSIDITDCGNFSGVDWIGSTYHWPFAGDIDAGEDLWINTESYQQGAGVTGEVVYTSDGGSTWLSKGLSHNGIDGNNDLWHANLGSFPAGATIQYAVAVEDGNGVSIWDNNGGQDFFAMVNGGDPVQWIGNTYHWPTNGAINAGNDLWINIESYPAGTAAKGSIIYSTDGGTTWQGVDLVYNGTEGDNDHWHKNMGSFPSGVTVEYAVKIEDSAATETWDNNGGSNFTAIVNGPHSSLQWFGDTRHRSVLFPNIGITADPQGTNLTIGMFSLKEGISYTVEVSADLMNWTPSNSFVSAGGTQDWHVPMNFSDPDMTRYYRVKAENFPLAGAVFSGEDVIIEIETFPVGAALGVNLIYSTDGGSTWDAEAMELIGPDGQNDLWRVNLGTYPIGTTIEYAIEVIDDLSNSQWDNNDAFNYAVLVLDPDQDDFDPPTTSYSPANTVTENATLDVSLFASDTIDPSPTIYYTTDGSTPTTSSSQYGAPIHVTDQGAGVDMTIKFFADDDAGNASGITTIEVKVNETFNFGPSKPYSTNPTLGQRVSNGAITIDGSNGGEWNTNMLIAIDMANDDPRSLGDNWTMHEAPVDFSHMWAAWDDNNLYLAWQLVDITDTVDPNNAGSGDVVSGNDGILQWIVLDTDSGAGATLDMWDKNNGEPYWTGVDKPDFQIYIASSLWQGYISEAVDGVFPVDDGGVHYFSIAAAGITAANGNSLVPSELWGTWDCDQRNDTGAPNTEFLSAGHAQFHRDSFYEMSIPLSHLGITATDLETSGLGVMIGSSLDTIPHDETTVDLPGVEVWNSSFEWGDTDSLTAPFARVGVWK